jgi:hypothetical protein
VQIERKELEGKGFISSSEQNGCCKSAWIVSSEIMMSQSLFVATPRRGSGVHSNLKNQ